MLPELASVMGVEGVGAGLGVARIISHFGSCRRWGDVCRNKKGCFNCDN